MSDIPECFYRVSVKALVLDKTRDKFLICEEDNGRWELPGGGLDWGASPQEDLRREIKEEMGVNVTSVAENPAYFITDCVAHRNIWIVNVLYETTLENLNIIPSDECVGVKYVDREDVREMNVFPTVAKLAAMFDPKNHKA